MLLFVGCGDDGGEADSNEGSGGRGGTSMAGSGGAAAGKGGTGSGNAGEAGELRWLGLELGVRTRVERARAAWAIRGGLNLKRVSTSRLSKPGSQPSTVLHVTVDGSAEPDGSEENPTAASYPP